MSINQKKNYLSLLPVGTDFQEAVKNSSCNIKKYNTVSYLPNDILDTVFLESVQNAKKKLKDADFCFFEKVVYSILEKMKSNGRENPEWTTKDYLKWYSIFQHMTQNQLDVSQNVVLRIFSMSNSEIMEELHYFENRLDFYPEVTRIYVEEEKRYQITNNEVEALDIFSLISTFHSQLQKFIFSQANYLYDYFEDYDTFLEMISEIRQEESDKNRNALLTPFYNEFEYLRKSPIFFDLYLYYREQYFQMVASCCSKKNRLIEKQISLERKTNVEFRNYMNAFFLKKRRRG